MVISMIANVLLFLAAAWLWKKEKDGREGNTHQKGVASFWKSCSDRKDTEIFELNRQIQLLRDWIKKKWNEEGGA